ncbi:hypothetical protein [Nonomuraea sp. SBT364]|uniref:hypothetical protein n=1 Tax=Nonomuraea sp. SBT364 TaxID=1580530 RepID=UPI0009EC780A|nr:hypothetical protein [Nonomuraea sp. SBT364]
MGVVVLIGAVAGGWLLLRQGGGGEPRPKLSAIGDPREPVRSPVAKAVKLRPISGDQLCAAIPDALRKSMVTDGRYGGRDAATAAATESEKRASCSWSNSKMDVGNGVIGYRHLSISVEAKSSESRDALTYAKERFADDKESAVRRVNVRDGKRVDGKTSGSSFGEIKELQYGDASYSQSSIGHSGLKAVVRVLQGPWLIEIEYGGDNRTGNKYPGGDEVRAAANKVAERIAAEMAKDAGKVKLTGPCAILAARDIEAAFFPAVEGPSVGGNDGRIKQTGCTWNITEAVEHEPGQEYTARGGRLNVHVTDWGGGDSGSAFQFDRDAKKYDRYRAQGGIGNEVSHTTYEPRQQIAGLGDKAFAVISATTDPREPERPPRMELLIKVLAGDRTVEFTFRGTTTGGGIVGADGYQAPAFDPSTAREGLEKLAKSFMSGLQ